MNELVLGMIGALVGMATGMVMKAEADRRRALAQKSRVPVPIPPEKHPPARHKRSL